MSRRSCRVVPEASAVRLMPFGFEVCAVLDEPLDKCAASGSDELASTALRMPPAWDMGCLPVIRPIDSVEARPRAGRPLCAATSLYAVQIGTKN